MQIEIIVTQIKVNDYMRKNNWNIKKKKKQTNMLLKQRIRKILSCRNFLTVWNVLVKKNRKNLINV